MHILNTFYILKLALDLDDPLPGQQLEEPPPIIIKDQQEQEIEEILNVKRGYSKYSSNNLLIRVYQLGYNEDLIQYPISNFECAKDLLHDFYEQHLEKPRPDWLNEDTDPDLDSSDLVDIID